MSKGKRGIGLDRPCPKCGTEVPYSYVSPVSEGLCGKCTDQALKDMAPKLAASVSSTKSTYQKVGGGSTIIGFALGIGIGVLGMLGLALAGPRVFDNIVAGLRRLL